MFFTLCLPSVTPKMAAQPLLQISHMPGILESYAFVLRVFEIPGCQWSLYLLLHEYSDRYSDAMLNEGFPHPHVCVHTPVHRGSNLSSLLLMCM